MTTTRSTKKQDEANKRAKDKDVKDNNAKKMSANAKKEDAQKLPAEAANKENKNTQPVVKQRHRFGLLRLSIHPIGSHGKTKRAKNTHQAQESKRKIALLSIHCAYLVINTAVFDRWPLEGDASITITTWSWEICGGDRKKKQQQQ